MSSENKDIFEWLFLKKEFFKSSKFRGAVSTVLILLVLVIVIPLLIQFSAALWGLAEFDSLVEQHESVRNLGFVVAAMLGVPFVVWRSVVAQKQVDVAEQGQITDRINKAVQGLGAERSIKVLFEKQLYKKDKDGEEWLKDVEGELVPATQVDGEPLIERESFEKTVPNIEVRVGAIYALERLAQDSLRDHLQIMEILCAYIRENSPVKRLESRVPPCERPIPRTDIQAAATVIGRRSEQQIKLEWKEKFRLDLRAADLAGVDFSNGDWSAAQFHGCCLEATNFYKSKLKGTQFYRALLNFADFFGAEIQGTNFYKAIIKYSQGPLNTVFHTQNIYGMLIAGADFSRVEGLSESIRKNLVYGSLDTILVPSLQFKPEKINDIKYKICDLREEGKTDEANELEAEMYRDNGFVDWFSYRCDDMALGAYQKDFLDRLGLTDWPYQGN